MSLIRADRRHFTGCPGEFFSDFREHASSHSVHGSRMELPFAVEQSTTIHLNNGDSGGGTNNDGSRTTPSSSIRQQHSQQLEQSETDSLVTASSHGSLIDASCLMEDEEGENDDDDANNVFIDYNNDIHRHQRRQERHQRAAAVVGVCGDGVTNVSSSSPGGGPLPPNTPQDVVLPARRPSHQQQPQQRGQQHQEHVVVVTSSQDHQQPQQRHGHRHPHHQTLTEISSRGTVQVQDEGIHVVAVAAGGGGHSRRPLPPPPPPPPEADFTYVDVTSDDSGVDALLEGEVVVDLPLTGPSAKRPDILTVLLGGIHQYNQFDVLLQQIEHANHMAQKASDAKSDGDIVSAMEYHAKAAQSYRDNAYELRDKSRKFDIRRNEQLFHRQRSTHHDLCFVMCCHAYWIYLHRTSFRFLQQPVILSLSCCVPQHHLLIHYSF